MSVEYIILGLLDRPASGYDIKRDFDEIFNNFWAAEQSQIYRTLKSLERRGLVSSKLEPSRQGPPRRSYRRTSTGGEALFEWLEQEPQIGDLRLPYLAQIFFLDRLGDLDRTERVLRSVKGHFEARLDHLLGIDEGWHGESDPEHDDDEDFHAYLVLRHGISRARAQIDWATDSLERLARRQRQRAEAPERERKTS